MSSEEHLCAAPSCEIEIRPDHVACRGHWKALPLGMRNRAVRHIRKGKVEVKLPPSKAWLDAACAVWRDPK